MHVHPRGPVSAALLDLLGGPADDVDALHRLQSAAGRAVEPGADLVLDEDVQLSLYLCYELHYSGNLVVAGRSRAADPDADPDWEWHPGLLGVRHTLEAAFETQLRSTCTRPVPARLSDVPDVLFTMAEGGAEQGDAPPSTRPGDRRRPTSVASFVARHATLEQVREALVLRAPYQLKEADPHTFAIPRLRGRAKAALVEIQVDEYGLGRRERMHAELFARAMRSLRLDDRPNAYLDAVPGVALAGTNALSMFALHRRLRGALCGHLAAFEMTSSLPAKRYVSGLQRLGLPEDAWLFFDEHVEADAVHEQVAARDLCGGLLDDEPELAADVLLGAATCHALDGRAAQHTLAAWADGGTALRAPLLPSRTEDRHGDRDGPPLHGLPAMASTADDEIRPTG